MTERPLLFNGAMVRAVLAGTKTQTRRLWKMPKGMDWYVSGALRGEDTGDICDVRGPGWCSIDEVSCPYGVPGDRLWVRETFFAFGRWETRFSEEKSRDEWHFVDLTTQMDRLYQYTDPTPFALRRRADATPVWWRRPAIHMPRTASRMTLEVTGVRVERLQDVSEADAASEGVAEWARGACAAGNPMGYTNVGYFSLLWESINGPGSWNANPWLWVVEFRRTALGSRQESAAQGQQTTGAGQ